MGFVEMFVNQDTARHSMQHVLRADRCYAHGGPQSTILGGSNSLIGLGPLKTVRFLWFRDSQFLLTYSPFTKE